MFVILYFLLQYKAIPIHELFHALGSWHQQSRPDRDDYVEIIFANVQSGREHNFNKHPNADVLDTVYSYRSVMHYFDTVSRNTQRYRKLLVYY